jgi:3-dehydrotetronate 4-kinase
MTLLVGTIADDFTGATDIASMLTQGGVRTLLLIGVPHVTLNLEHFDAIVIALKSRSSPSGEAVEESSAALIWLRQVGAQQIYFKYCSTFDSTPQGNIGPVAERLLSDLTANFTIFCPAFPANGRTVYGGYLFVGDQLLSETGMRSHPITPMTDSNLVRVLANQSRSKVGLVSHREVSRGPNAVRARFDDLRGDGVRFSIIDATSDSDLRTIADAASDLSLITGGSGLALALPDLFRARGLLAKQCDPLAEFRPASRLSAAISGSCSPATLRQIEVFRQKGYPSHEIDPLTICGEEIERVIKWGSSKVGTGPILIYASASSDRVLLNQQMLGPDRAAGLVEDALSRIAVALVEHGVRRLVVAGGETSGSVVKALALTALRIGPLIDPGVPWTATMDPDPLALALKSGNFGADDFFEKAFRSLQ